MLGRLAAEPATLLSRLVTISHGELPRLQRRLLPFSLAVV
jgi:hypothetical protein